jgi:hypothetical protein
MHVNLHTFDLTSVSLSGKSAGFFRGIFQCSHNRLHQLSIVARVFLDVPKDNVHEAAECALWPGVDGLACS